MLWATVVLMDWNKDAKRVLRTELVRRGISYKMLSAMLEKVGVVETERAIQGKVARGTFTFAFFMQCMAAIGATKIDLEQ